MGKMGRVRKKKKKSPSKEMCEYSPVAFTFGFPVRKYTHHLSHMIMFAMNVL